MMKRLRDVLLAKDKKAVLYLTMLACVGALLLVLGNGLFFELPDEKTDLPLPGITEADTPNEVEAVSGGAYFVREQELENRLEEAFREIADVGKVRVLLSFSPETETVYAKDTDQTDSVSNETDSQGGSRETRDVTRQEETIMFTDSSGADRPLVLREIDQKIEGAVIIAEGGDSVFVKDALTKAACTILGIEANKVQVLKMKI